MGAPTLLHVTQNQSTVPSAHTIQSLRHSEPLRKRRTWLSYECFNTVNTFFFTVLLTLHNAHLISSYPFFFLWIPAECRYVIIQLLKSKQRQPQIKKTDTLIFSFLNQVLYLATLFFLNNLSNHTRSYFYVGSPDCAETWRADLIISHDACVQFKS